MNKQAGSTRELIQWLGYLLVTIGIIVFFFVVLYSQLNLKIDTTELQHDLILTNLVYSPSCLAYEDENIGVQIGKIDVNKLNNERLEKCLSKEKTGYFVFILNETGNVIKKAKNADLQTELQAPVCQVNKDFYTCTLNTKLIQYKVQDKFVTGFIVLGAITNVQ